MSTEEAQTQEVDRGDHYAAPEIAREEETPAVEAQSDQVEPEDLDLGVPQAAEEGVETEAAAAETTDDGQVRDDKGRFIPKERFDEAVQRERREKEIAVQRMQVLEQEKADREVAADMQQASARLFELTKEHTQLISDGDLDKAAEKMQELLNLQSDMAEHRAMAMAQQSGAQTKSEIQYDAVVAKLEIDYPEINPDNTDQFDREAVRRVQAYMTGLIQIDGIAPSAALQEAVGTILGAKRAEQQQSEASKAKEAEELGVRRKEAAVTKAVEARGKQPANTTETGKDHDTEGGSLDAAAVMKMDWEEFVNLPESKLSELRGDHV
jgi:hypothetical protein